MSCVFGPVPSRRLGRSLGLDLTPFKTCSYDCVYCQLGRTTCLTATRAARIDVPAVLDEVASRLASAPDYLTLAGSGEPTLELQLGELLAGLKDLTATPVAVLTNGSLLSDPAVREALCLADLVAPSLDAGSPEVFQRVNRPHPGLAYATMVAGLQAFRESFRGRYQLEVFLVDGLNTTPDELAGMRTAIDDLEPDEVQVNTATRPTADPGVGAIPSERLTELTTQLGPRAVAIAHYGTHHDRQDEGHASEVLALLERRPCTLSGVADGLGIHRNHVAKHLGALLEAGRVESTTQAGEVYYRVVGPPPERREGS